MLKAMRNALLSLAMAVPMGIGQAQSHPSMPADVGSGRVAWFDITTTDLARSKDFYGKLFGWTFRSVEGTNLAAEIVAKDAAIGTIRVAHGPISRDNGVVYVQVEDISASCNRARELGATVVPGFPFNLSNGTGAIGLIIDPAGHPLGMYSRTPIVSPD